MILEPDVEPKRQGMRETAKGDDRLGPMIDYRPDHVGVVVERGLVPGRRWLVGRAEGWQRAHSIPM